MADTGWLSAGTITTDGMFPLQWQTPSNASTSNDSYTIYGGANTNSTTLTATNFNASVPSGATITGIETRIERKSNFASTWKDLQVQLVKGGSASGTDKADTSTTYTTSDVTVTYGGSSDLWGNTLSQSDVNATNFGIAFRAQNTTTTNAFCSVDMIQIKVYYTTGGGSSYTLSVTQNGLQLTRRVVNLTKQKKLIVTQKAVYFTPRVVALKRGYTLSVNSKSLRLTPSSVLQTIQRKITAQYRSLLLTPKTVVLTRSYSAQVTSREVRLTSYSVGITASRFLAVTNEELLLSPKVVNITYGSGGYSLTVNFKSLSFTGNSVGISTSRRLSIASNSLKFTPEAVNLRRELSLSVNSKPLFLTDNTTILTRYRSVTITSRFLQFTPKSVGLTAQRKVSVLSKSLLFNDAFVNLIRSFSVGTSSRAVSLTPRTIGIAVQRKTQVARKQLLVTPKIVNLFVQGQSYALQVTTKAIILSPTVINALTSRKLPIARAVLYITSTEVSLTKTTIQPPIRIIGGYTGMVTVTGICNQALGMIGSNNRITSLSEGSDEARNCNLYYDQTRLEILQAIPWGFTRRKIALALLGSASGTPENPNGDQPISEYGWDYSYAYPSNCLKPLFLEPSEDGVSESNLENMGQLRNISNATVPFAESTMVISTGVFQRSINTDKRQAVLIYQADVSNSALYPPDFISVLVQTLAGKLALSVLSNPQMGQALAETARKMIEQAKVNHSMEFNVDRKRFIYEFDSNAISSRY
ncbi:tail tubular protein a tubular protein [Caudoviricetes sp.]|nr:tail tubular protein a tubular protein [Caudoviricetes sp.]